ncbi:IS3 family transposase, partial [Burkholderia cenocepacia]|uniref:IS3 family transposase n=3 Tax=Burkholderia cenocepacia TaxID=95486 RepID=UPI001F4B7600
PGKHSAGKRLLKLWTSISSPFNNLVLRRPVESTQYQMPAYRRLLKQHALTQSMSRRGNCLDNAAMESFFGTLKSECYRLTRFASVEQLRDALSRYIHYYNHERIKLKLNGLSPVQYRTQPLAA